MNRKNTLIFDYLITLLAVLSYLFHAYTYNFIFVLITLILVCIRVFIFIPRYGNYYRRSSTFLEIVTRSIIVPIILLIQTNENINIIIKLTLFILGVIGYSVYYFYLIKKKYI